MAEYRGEVWQDGFLVARAEGGNYAQVNAETAHYAMMYAQDGPVAVRHFEKKTGKRWKRCDVGMRPTRRKESTR